MFGLLFAQSNIEEQPTFSDFQISSERYLTDDKGNIMMYVNVWGHVGSPGHHLIYDGIDLATLMSVVGGPNTGANMKKVRVYREIPEEDGTLVYYLDFEKFVSSGDRSEFIRIKPNDTIIIPENISNYILTQVGTLNTFLSLFNLYFQLTN
jgi:protein involved in polysaccharide export with SLBB domain